MKHRTFIKSGLRIFHKIAAQFFIFENHPFKAQAFEGQAQLQDQVDYYCSLFVNAVASHRGFSVATVLASMADGRTFIGQQGIDAGLIDGIATLEELIVRMSRAAAPA